jgi:hypothetical protein
MSGARGDHAVGIRIEQHGAALTLAEVADPNLTSRPALAVDFVPGYRIPQGASQSISRSRG